MKLNGFDVLHACIQLWYMQMCVRAPAVSSPLMMVIIGSAEDALIFQTDGALRH